MRQGGRGDHLRVSCYNCTSRPEHRDLGYRNKHLKKKYGITLHQFSKMYVAQDGKCAICARGLSHGGETPGKGKGRPPNDPCVDHCHTSGEVRGLLCFHCNTALGHAFDDPKILGRMIEYIR